MSGRLREGYQKIRKKYAKKLTEEVQKALIDLNFLDVRFTMEFKEAENPSKRHG